MSKKIFTLLLLAVFVLAQFSIASAAQVAGDTALSDVDTFSDNFDIDLAWSVTGMDGGAPQELLVWSRIKASPANAWGDCQDVINLDGLTDANGVFTYVYTAAPADQATVEFKVVVDDSTCGGGAVAPTLGSASNGSTFIDSIFLDGFVANPPSVSALAFDAMTVACNTFEMWGLVSDQYGNGAQWSSDGYSGVKTWKPTVTGTFAPPAPLGDANQLLSWVYTIPSTASGAWSFTVTPSDYAGNAWTPTSFRTAVGMTAGQRASCADFTDTAGHGDEVYIRYLADLGLIAGNPDGSFGPDTTLTRAEAAVLFEKANGFTDLTLPVAPVAGCSFTDVAATDWFAGWVWQACDDGFMNGVGGGLFDPSNTLTRGQIVTIFNNINAGAGGVAGSYLDFGAFNTVVETEWNGWAGGGWPELRQGTWNDVSVGAYYALPVVAAYGVGVADGTSSTTFSPDQAALRGEFAKMLYRALSRVP